MYHHRVQYMKQKFRRNTSCRTFKNYLRSKFFTLSKLINPRRFFSRSTAYFRLWGVSRINFVPKVFLTAGKRSMQVKGPLKFHTIDGTPCIRARGGIDRGGHLHRAIESSRAFTWPDLLTAPINFCHCRLTARRATAAWCLRTKSGATWGAETRLTRNIKRRRCFVNEIASRSRRNARRHQDFSRKSGL